MSDEIMEATNAVLLSGKSEGALFSEISTDSRKISRGDLFLALRGEQFNGHDFIEKAMENGAAGIIMDQGRWPEKKEFFKEKALPVFGVARGLSALGNLGRYRRKKFGVKVIAITGSNGKTSTKEFLKSIFKEEVSFLATEGNFNNEVGLPLTLLRLKPENEWAILELGISHPGEMTRLSAICEPDMALITRVDPAHLEGLGSMEGVAKAKGEIFSGMKAGGVAMVNGSDPGSAFLPLRKDLSNLFFGKEAGCDFRIRNILPKENGTSFEMETKIGKTLYLETGIPGSMMAENAFAAASLAMVAGMSEKSIRAGILNFKGYPGRFEKLEGPAGSIIVNDTYNANPQSMEKALEQLALLSGHSRSIAILGSMGELGENSDKLHFNIGALAAKTGLAALFCYGPKAEKMAEGAKNAGFQGAFILKKEEIAKEVKPLLQNGDWILVKGSRSMSMETVVDDLIAMK